MKRHELKIICADIVQELSRRPYETWKSTSYPAAFERKIGDLLVYVELVLLEDTHDYIHVGVAVDDGSAMRSIWPVSSSFIVKASAVSG